MGLSSLLFLVSCGGAPAPTPTSAPDVDWRPWERATFEEAQRTGKHLLVSVQASWCHWCHVMNDETYTDPEVRRLLHEGYIAIKVDSDARPDLADRYQDYGWPATILLSPNAEEILPMRGYRAPNVFSGFLRDVREGQVPDVPEEEPPASDLDEIRSVARVTLDDLYDEAQGGWGLRQKYPYGAPVEHAFFRSLVLGEEDWMARALHTAEGYTHLIDPEDGGVYQYSLRGDWDHPHFERIAGVQADTIGTLARAIRLGGANHRESLMAILGYLSTTFRSPAGGFYTSQNADLSHEVNGTVYFALPQAERVALGVPRVDTAVYADLNGRLIEALVEVERSLPGEGAIGLAIAAAEEIERTHREGALFRHAPGAPLFHLTDQAWMLRAELALYSATGERRWLDYALRTAEGAEELRESTEAAYSAHSEDPDAIGSLARRRQPLNLNGVMARALIRLDRLHGWEARDGEANRSEEDSAEESGRESEERIFWNRALTILRALAIPSRVRGRGRKGAEYLLALEEAQAPYVLVSIVGPDAPETRALRDAALQAPSSNLLVETHLPGNSRYPFPGRSAAFLCNHDSCSLPVFEPSALPDALARFLRAD